jgi:hypothetical protein
MPLISGFELAIYAYLVPLNAHILAFFFSYTKDTPVSLILSVMSLYRFILGINIRLEYRSFNTIGFPFSIR